MNERMAIAAARAEESILHRAARQAGEVSGAAEACVCLWDGHAGWSSKPQRWFEPGGAIFQEILALNGRAECAEWTDPSQTLEWLAMPWPAAAPSSLGFVALGFPPGAGASNGRERLLIAASGVSTLVEMSLQVSTEIPDWFFSGQPWLPPFRCLTSLEGIVEQSAGPWSVETGVSLFETSADAPLWRGLMGEALTGGQASVDRLALPGGPIAGPVHAQILYRDGKPAQVLFTGWPATAHTAGAGLTHLQFHRAWMESLALIKPEAPFLPMALIDIDAFSQVNQWIGVFEGDRVLEAMHDRLEQYLHSAGCVCRVGGDVYCIMMPACRTTAEVEAKAEDLLAEMRRPLRLGAHEVSLSLSAGISLGTESGPDCMALFSRASRALGIAKSSGRSQVVLYREEWNEELRVDQVLYEVLREPLSDSWIGLRFQPQVALDGHLDGFEVLLEFAHPFHGLLPLPRLIEVAEQSGRIVELGAIVLNLAAQQAAAWRRAYGFTGRLAVNVSAVQFEHPGFLESLHNALREAELPGEALELELTETAFIGDLERVRNKLLEVRSLGVAVCMDDFGAGYSSLARLRDLPLDVLKLDRAFMSSQGQGVGSLAFLHTFAILARNLGLRVTAEGIESEDQLRAAALARCDRVQGFLLSQPLDRAAAEQLLRDKRRWPDVRVQEFEPGQPA